MHLLDFQVISLNASRRNIHLKIYFPSCIQILPISWFLLLKTIGTLWIRFTIDLIDCLIAVSQFHAFIFLYKKRRELSFDEQSQTTSSESLKSFYFPSIDNRLIEKMLPEWWRATWYKKVLYRWESIMEIRWQISASHFLIMVRTPSKSKSTIIYCNLRFNQDLWEIRCERETEVLGDCDNGEWFWWKLLVYIEVDGIKLASITQQFTWLRMFRFLNGKVLRVCINGTQRTKRNSLHPNDANCYVVKVSRLLEKKMRSSSISSSLWKPQCVANITREKDF